MDEDFNIISLSEMRYDTVDGVDMFNMFTPTMIMNPGVELVQYVVRADDEGRIDNVMQSLYGEPRISDVDVILYINNIDNPMNIVAGQVILAPANALDIALFRYDPASDKIDLGERNRLLGKTSEPNKSATADPNRTKYLEKTYFPPTVKPNPSPGVRVQGGNFVIGGIN